MTKETFLPQVFFDLDLKTSYYDPILFHLLPYAIYFTFSRNTAEYILLWLEGEATAQAARQRMAFLIGMIVIALPNRVIAMLQSIEGQPLGFAQDFLILITMLTIYKSVYNNKV